MLTLRHVCIKIQDLTTVAFNPIFVTPAFAKHLHPFYLGDFIYARVD